MTSFEKLLNIERFIETDIGYELNVCVKTGGAEAAFRAEFLKITCIMNLIFREIVLFWGAVKAFDK